ncbi:putative nuclease HARBI1 [Lucilia cuprina]|nr:putative nuclease HARBI1 [Lucilia cuprina]
MRATDGKHIKIKHPPGTGSLYYNYKGTYSIVLMAIANARKEFIMIDIGCNGRVSDGGVLFYSKFWEKLQQGRLNLPPPSALPGTVEKYPHAFMKPYPQKKASKEEEIFNRQLSKARSVIECCFGILAAKFGVFQKAMSLSPQKAAKVTAACCYLHNFLMKREQLNQPSNATEDFELSNTDASDFLNTTDSAKTIRDHFCK